MSQVESGDRRYSSESSEASAHSPGILDTSSSSVFSPLPKAKSPEQNHSRFGRDSGLGDSQLKSFSFPKRLRKSQDTSRLSPSTTRISENSLIDPYAEVSAKRKDGVFCYPDRPDAQSTPFHKNPKLSCNRSPVPFKIAELSLNDSMGEPSCLASYDAFSYTETTDSVEELKNPPRTRNRSQEVQDRTSAFRNKKTAFKSMLVDWEVHFDDLILERELPGGRFGTKCHICKWHGKCVIRVAKVDLKPENPNVQAFKQELHHFKKTRHDNVELFLGACLTPPNLAILTRYYQGPRLDKKIKEESLSLDNARLLADHIINGLKYLHAKDILHKDLRPANIMYDLVGKAVIKGLGLATVSALTGVGSIRNNPETEKYYIDVPTDWIHRLSPELATIDLEKCQNSSIIPKLNYSKKSDIYAFGVLWAELMQAVHRSSQPAPLTLRRENDFNSSRRVEKSELRIDLNTPPTDNFESKLFNAGLGSKIEVPDPIQDQARCLINRCVERSPTNRPDCEWIAERLDKVQPNAGRLTRRCTYTAHRS
ncbi:unnamed protein product [Oikopleura dioica]|nr:unnamed protein product [Oikopleura dioica]